MIGRSPALGPTSRLAASPRLVVALAVLAAACGGGGSSGGIDVTRQSAQPLGTIARELPADERQQARLAWQQDAWRREHRFIDATEPGHLFRSARIRQVEIDAGLWTVDELYQLGGQLFTLDLSPALGGGGGDGPPLRRIHQGQRGGPDARRCTSCHWRGGPAGAGDAADNGMLRGDGIHQSSSIARNPPALVGAGLRERLAAEMSAELQELRDDAIQRAARTGESLRLPIRAKGIGFGVLTVDPEGNVDTRELVGVDADLIIRPFGWKGTIATVRDTIEDELLVHHGMQSEHLVIRAAQGSTDERGERVGPERIGPFGGDDPDGDGIIEEVTEGQVTALTVFVGLQEVPQQEIPDDDPYLATLWARGRNDFEALGCATCHVPELPLDSAELTIPHRYGGPRLRIDLSTEGAEPRIAPSAQGDALALRLYSDLRRHAMGSQLAEPRAEQGVPADVFVTPPLWGLAHSRPYLHDGRAPTIEDAILLHGGEALDARDAYARLDDEDRAPLRVFLSSLVRARRLVAH